MKIKLLNISICHIFLVIVLINFIECQLAQQKQLSVQKRNVTPYERPIERILTRRKRFLVYRPGSFVLLTAVLVKPMVFGANPNAFSQILEWDMYFPLPTSWKKPEPKKPEILPPPPPSPPPPPQMLPHHEEHDHDHHDHHDHDFTNGASWEHDHPGEVWVPPSGWVSGPANPFGPPIDTLKDLPMGTPDKEETPNDNSMTEKPGNDTKRYWNVPQSSKWYGNNFHLPPVTHFGKPLINGRKQNQEPVNGFNQQQWQLGQTQKWNVQSHYIPDGGRSMQSHQHNDEDYENWEHYYAHRDRRDLYQRMEEAFGKSMELRNCLLRTICEVQHFLLPPGYSLLHDTFRVIFTIPWKKGLDDDYSDAMQRTSPDDCHEVYGQHCPMSVLSFFLHSKN